jgi:hypothetical protein
MRNFVLSVIDDKQKASNGNKEVLSKIGNKKLFHRRALQLLEREKGAPINSETPFLDS